MTPVRIFYRFETYERIESDAHSLHIFYKKFPKLQLLHGRLERPTEVLKMMLRSPNYTALPYSLHPVKRGDW